MRPEKIFQIRFSGKDEAVSAQKNWFSARIRLRQGYAAEEAFLIAVKHEHISTCARKRGGYVLSEFCSVVVNHYEHRGAYPAFALIRGKERSYGAASQNPWEHVCMIHEGNAAFIKDGLSGLA
ncbi:hypothetical protein [Oligoflexus sp.]|uniref:hypothetical protein n=1 Tax=Oligoflexus sp. TaxID=1971216 RepID=UPI002D78BA64|nr:hypothetical protein [Oligoflexus sp.]